MLAKTGKVKFFDEFRGFGFIISDQTREEIYVHISETEEYLEKNDRVAFEIAKGKRGIRAIKVRILKEEV